MNALLENTHSGGQSIRPYLQILLIDSTTLTHNYHSRKSMHTRARRKLHKIRMGVVEPYFKYIFNMWNVNMYSVLS